jgi:diguanylate cyclase (GGDEF)-like protein
VWISPTRVILILAATIFMAEVFVMLLLPRLPPLPALAEAGADAGVLVMLITPSLYFLLLRPMWRQIAERESAVRALEHSNAHLEQRVQERTAALAEAGQDVRDSLLALGKTHQESLLLSKLIDLLQACRTAAESENMLRSFGQKLFPNECGAIYVYRSSRNLLELAASWGSEEDAAPMFTPEDCWALRRGRQHLVEYADQGLSCRHLKDLKSAASALCIPMMAQGEATGMMLLYKNRASGHGAGMSKEVLRLAPMASEQIALTLANLQLREKLRDQAIRDPLTGMFNRRYFEETAERELRRAENEGVSVGVVMIDIDHFKRFNDQHGHDAGDAVLKKVALLIESKTRIEDIACRYGGEEFVVLLPKIQPETGLARVEELREAVRDMDVRHNGVTLANLSISCGVALFPDDGRDLRILLEASDRALYEAKHNGRNRVIFASGVELG